MKYLIKYFPFFEAGISMADSLKRYLTASPAMQDIQSLISKGRGLITDEQGKVLALHWRKRQGEGLEEKRVKEPLSYKVKKEGDIFFDKEASNRYFGQEVYLLRQPNGDYKVVGEKNSIKKFEQIVTSTADGTPAVEVALRYAWAIFVSTTKEYKVSTRYIPETTIKKLLDPNNKIGWGQKKTAVEILQELGIETLDTPTGKAKGEDDDDDEDRELDQMQDPIVDLKNVVHLLNESFVMLGMTFKLENINQIVVPTKFGVITGQDNLLSLILRGMFDANSNDGGTYEEMDKKIRIIQPLTRFRDDKVSIKKRRNRYFIQPRTTEEAFIQCLIKIRKIFKKNYTAYKFENLKYAGKTLKNTNIRLFIEKYTAVLENEVRKKGLSALNEEELFYKVIFAAITDDKGTDDEVRKYTKSDITKDDRNKVTGDVYELSNIVKKNAPTFWDKLSSYDVEGMAAAADMGDRGFAD